jgi:hypothetical protein
MIPYAQLTPGRGFQMSRAVLYYSQRLVTHSGLRRAVAAAIAAGIRLRHRANHQPDPDQGTIPSSVLTELRQHGIAMLPSLLNNEELRRIESYLHGKEVVGPDGRLRALSDLPIGTCSAAYPLGTVLNCPGVLEFAEQSALLDLATSYLGCPPTLSSIGIRWSFPADGYTADVQRFHRDLDDWRFFKVFLYLTDVDERTGPHIYITDTHLTSGRIIARPYTEQEIDHSYGTGHARVVIGPRGTTFVADTYGVHKGLIPIDRPRLILQAQYSLLPIYAFDYESVAVRGNAPTDRYLLRLLVKE